MEEVEVTVEQPAKIQDDFLSFLASTKESEIEKLNTFAVDALIFSVKLNIYHWTCKSGFHHEHFQKVYECVRDFADKLVETVMSMGKEFKTDSKTYLINDELYDLNNAILKIQNFRDEVEKLKKQYSSKVSLDNIFADTIEELDKEIGLLKNFS